MARTRGRGRPPSTPTQPRASMAGSHEVVLCCTLEIKTIQALLFPLNHLTCPNGSAQADHVETPGSFAHLTHSPLLLPAVHTA
eukprot:7126858-Karenia_brevis.AAC.1